MSSLLSNNRAAARWLSIQKPGCLLSAKADNQVFHSFARPSCCCCRCCCCNQMTSTCNERMIRRDLALTDNRQYGTPTGYYYLPIGRMDVDSNISLCDAEWRHNAECIRDVRKIIGCKWSENDWQKKLTVRRVRLNVDRSRTRANTEDKRHTSDYIHLQVYVGNGNSRVPFFHGNPKNGYGVVGNGNVNGNENCYTRIEWNGNQDPLNSPADLSTLCWL